MAEHLQKRLPPIQSIVVDNPVILGGGDYRNNIFKMAASGLRIGLRAAMAEAKTVRRRVQHDNLSIRVGDRIQPMMLTVQPMPESITEAIK